MVMLRQVVRITWQRCVERMNIQKQSLHNVQSQPLEREFEEIQIPVPWGHISGKCWGSLNAKPVLCLHGYQDNAGTWDTLAPLLPHDISLLAVDLPGHGLSSHIPTGNAYHLLDFVLAIQRIVNHYGWKKISLMGHSFGSISGFVYSALYPEQVEHFIALDTIKRFNTDPARKLKNHGEILDKFLHLDSLDPKSSPSYIYEDAVEHLHKSMEKCTTKGGCEILSRRGTIKMTDGSYSFSRDARLKASVDLSYTWQYVLQFAANVKCKVLHIQALQGLTLEKPEEMDEFLDVLKKSAALYESHTVEGRHYVHLDFPERVAPIISDFLKQK
ncbi:probable serine hydrolase isoform X3 [Zootermopsis nevadensis]|uniref:probable serine hydrolase isoform X3 n=1 Tax=Zootermopsis nevadensis TaxID=136037 RepID=UPI000B8E2E1B|nr:probable serine hydrolase isoform X3 [Zootermopsis nevadensis]